MTKNKALKNLLLLLTINNLLWYVLMVKKFLENLTSGLGALYFIIFVGIACLMLIIATGTFFDLLTNRGKGLPGPIVMATVAIFVIGLCTYSNSSEQFSFLDFLFLVIPVLSLNLTLILAEYLESIISNKKYDVKTILVLLLASWGILAFMAYNYIE